MVDVDHDHLGGATGGAARLDGAGGAVADLEEAHQAGRAAAVILSSPRKCRVFRYSSITQDTLPCAGARASAGRTGVSPVSALASDFSLFS